MERTGLVKRLVSDKFQADEMLKRFWEIHIMAVEKLARELAQKYGADMEIILLGIYLHDIGWLKDPTGRTHDLEGLSITEEMMAELGYDAEAIEKVKSIIRTHSCRTVMPSTLEEKIIATADGMSQFRGDFFIFMLWNDKRDIRIEDKVRKAMEGLERAFNSKFFFKEERKTIRPYYEAYKLIFGSN